MSAKHDDIKNIKVRDCLPLNVGVEDAGGIMYVLLAKNTKVPCEMSYKGTTSYDN